MGNQQVKTHFEIGWLVGFIEGEGCLTINRIKGYGKSNKLLPYISLVGTNTASMERAIEIAKNLELPMYISNRSYGPRNPVIRIEATGLGRTAKWLAVIEPYLVGKKRQAELMLEFIASREISRKKHPWMKPYTDEELAIYDQIHILNRGYNRPKSKTPETTRRPWQQEKV